MMFVSETVAAFVADREGTTAGSICAESAYETSHCEAICRA
jgi:hypothetical protein